MSRTVVFDPLIALPALWALAIIAALLLAFALWKGLRGWPLRGLAFVALGVALANPSLQEENRKPLSDIVLLLMDESSSQTLSDRKAQIDAAVSRMTAEVAALENTELRVIRFGDGPEDAGSLAMTALAQAMAEEPRARIAGAILITDGQVHDLGLAPALPAPLQVLLTGKKQDWDRHLIIKDAPAFAILGEEFILKLKVEDKGAVPDSAGAMVTLTIGVDSDAPMTFDIPLNEDLELPVRLPHAGMNVLQFSVAPVAGELTDRNNVAVVQVNGVRDRLRVLLVSGEPHAGERVWRNLLKSDPSVDLVHFTILRPPEKQDGVPVEELSLIAFPTRELFVEKIKDFDLIIFDRYRMRGILPMEYIDNVVQYVKNGGTVLVAAGPEFGAVDSLWRSPLAEILPVEPTSQVIEEGYKPKLTDLGRRHPVTEGLEALTPQGWGRWFRLIDVNLLRGQVLMSGAQDKPLLVLDRVDQGRIAVLASDQAWLWGRGYEGGGPQLELLRRLAHWMLKEPELEEEALTATNKSDVLTITRRTVSEKPPGELVITGPDGVKQKLVLPPAGPGKYAADWKAPALGLYRLQQDDLVRVVAVGPSAPKEFVETLASGDGLAPIVATMEGGILPIEAGLPGIRTVREGRPAAGRGWIGVTPRGAFVTEDLQISPLVPGWLMLILAAGLAVAAWLVEGRFKRRAA
ncbi:MAG: hypothetical protein U1A24_06155 [Cypionkella sp.]|uniref:hypothetical protein n=1 Tax=Cypionkella sp. TaxID=2811411 RepID=UPI002AB9BF28|nr:hypothetical protein [Cypionkella sp.]MDZ4310120.1 hypothetical protein [Cypionkella sp.]